MFRASSFSLESEDGLGTSCKPTLIKSVKINETPLKIFCRLNSGEVGTVLDEATNHWRLCF